MYLVQMSGHQYKRTNFDDDEQMLAESPGHTVHYTPPVSFKFSASCWGRRTLLERVLLVLLGILLLLIFILSCVVGSLRGTARQSPDSGAMQQRPITGICS